MVNKSGGFVVNIPLIIIAIVLITGVSIAVVRNNLNKDTQSENLPNPSTEASESASVTPSSTTKFSSTSKPTSTSNKTNSPKPSSSTNSNNSTSNPYTLTGASGAVKAVAKPKSGVAIGLSAAELIAKPGFKVLDGNSTDRQKRTIVSKVSDGSEEVIFSGVPAGPYTIRIQYQNEWSGEKEVNVEATKLSSAIFDVNGVQPTPTPTPDQTYVTTCIVNIASKSSESAPSNVHLAAGATYRIPPNLKDKYISEVQWDFNGDGTWDTEMAYSNQGVQEKIYDTAGTYVVKARVKMSDGEVTEVCSNSFTLN